MAMFPLAADSFRPELTGGSTSVFFHRQERAFFAQPGKEIIRVWAGVDLQNGAELETAPVKLSGDWPPVNPPPPPSASHPLVQSWSTSPDDFDDEAWRRPMPHAERRRAGKHTKRVVRT